MLRRLARAAMRFSSTSRCRMLTSSAEPSLKSLLDENGVLVLSTSSDPFGKRVKTFFDDLGVEYKSVEVDLAGETRYIQNEV